MQPRSFEERLTMLEKQMLETCELPARVRNLELQFVQLRQEMRDGFSEMGAQMRMSHEEALSRITTMGEGLGAQMRMLHEEALTRIATVGEGRSRRKK